MPDEFLSKVRGLVEEGRKENGGTKVKFCQEGNFVAYDAGLDDDDQPLYHDVLVPPKFASGTHPSLDPRELFKPIRVLYFSGQSLAWYWPKAPGEKLLARHDRNLQDYVNQVKKQEEPLKYLRGNNGARLSHGGKLLATIDYGIVSLVDLTNGDVVYRSLDGPKTESGKCYIIFSLDNKLAAYLNNNGDVVVVDIHEKRVKTQAKFPWPLPDTQCPVIPKQFVFSVDAKYVALNVRGPCMGAGSALIVWKTDSGKCAFTKSPNWELKKHFHISGFSDFQGVMAYEETQYWNLEDGEAINGIRDTAYPYPFPSGDWGM
jgi:hypothetical protein